MLREQLGKLGDRDMTFVGTVSGFEIVEGKWSSYAIFLARLDVVGSNDAAGRLEGRQGR